MRRFCTSRTRRRRARRRSARFSRDQRPRIRSFSTTSRRGSTTFRATGSGSRRCPSRRGGRCRWTTRRSTCATTCARRRCPRLGRITSSRCSPVASSPAFESGQAAVGDVAGRGVVGRSLRGLDEDAPRAWSMGSRASTSSRCCSARRSLVLLSGRHGRRRPTARFLSTRWASGFRCRPRRPAACLGSYVNRGERCPRARAWSATWGTRSPPVSVRRRPRPGTGGRPGRTGGSRGFVAIWAGEGGRECFGRRQRRDARGGRGRVAPVAWAARRGG